MSVEKFLEVRAKRKEITEQLKNWGDTFRYLAMLAEDGYSRTQKGFDYSKLPTPNELRDAHIQHTALLKEESELYNGLPASSRAELKSPPPILDY